MRFEPGDKIGGLTEDELIGFLDYPWNARIATVTRDGWPYVTPVWYEVEGESRRFLVVGREHALWVGHIRHNPRVAFHVADDIRAQHTRVLVQATAELVEGPVAPRASARIQAPEPQVFRACDACPFHGKNGALQIGHVAFRGVRWQGPQSRWRARFVVNPSPHLAHCRSWPAHVSIRLQPRRQRR